MELAALDDCWHKMGKVISMALSSQNLDLNGIPFYLFSKIGNGSVLNCAKICVGYEQALGKTQACHKFASTRNLSPSPLNSIDLSSPICLDC